MLKENKVRGLTLPYFKTYYRGTAIKTVILSKKSTQIEQWNRMESLEINPQKYKQLIFYKGTKVV